MLAEQSLAPPSNVEAASMEPEASSTLSAAPPALVQAIPVKRACMDNEVQAAVTLEAPDVPEKLPAPVAATRVQHSRFSSAQDRPTPVLSHPPAEQAAVEDPVHASTSQPTEQAAAAAASDVPNADAATTAPSALRARSSRCRDISCFETIRKLGEGTYGTVSLARDRTTGELVAIKYIKPDTMLERDGVPLWFVRELRALRALRHENVVSLKEVAVSPPSDANKMLGGTYMVFEVAPRTLEGMIAAGGTRMPPELVRSMMAQLLRALAHVAKRGWTHRDVKPANVLVTTDNLLKLADFGLAREMNDPRRQMTPEVVTLWYRAPELLYGFEGASYGVDVWSAGCVLGEMLIGRPLFAATDARTLIDRVYALCGVPSGASWPGLLRCPRYEALRPTKAYTPQFHAKFQGCDPLAVSLLEALLALSPSARISAEAALAHPYFTSAPLPPPASLPPWPPAPPRAPSPPPLALLVVPFRHFL